MTLYTLSAMFNLLGICQRAAGAAAGYGPSIYACPARATTVNVLKPNTRAQEESPRSGPIRNTACVLRRRFAPNRPCARLEVSVDRPVRSTVVSGGNSAIGSRRGATAQRVHA